jgi:VIT1/CCC1 family predicted Fe2+/Mn2+ transporter
MEIDHEHTPQAIALRVARGPRVNYLRDWVYGGIDGAVTTFAIVAGVIGANLSVKIVLILGAANLLADGFSMAAANYSGTKSEIDDYARIRRIEERHLANDPQGEREEVRQIFQAKGIEGEMLERVVEVVTHREDLWIDTMLAEEYGMSSVLRSSSKAALATFAAFIGCGFVPLVPFAIGLPASATIATAMTALTFFVIGSAKSRWSTQHWAVSGLETTVIGLAAAGLAFAIGWVLRDFAIG